MCQILVHNRHWALIFGGGGLKGGGGNLYVNVYATCKHFKNNGKFFKVFKSKIMKTQIVPQWAIRMQKKLYILKPYTKLSLPKKI